MIIIKQKSSKLMRYTLALVTWVVYLLTDSHGCIDSIDTRNVSRYVVTVPHKIHYYLACLLER